MIHEEFNPKHTPVVKARRVGEGYEVTVVVGEEVPHPNTPEHHIAWVELYFVPEEGETPFPVGRVEFAAHGVENVYAEPRAVFYARGKGPGKFVAIALCNIHGLWKGETHVE